jgi:glycosyltransferase involved in cell wall biosynthesis
MKLIYLIAAHNENSILPQLVQKLEKLKSYNFMFEVYILDNASHDNSRETLAALTQKHAWLKALHTEKKGLGTAFIMGLQHLSQLTLTNDTWVVFTAADLPFDYSDLDSFLARQPSNPHCELFLGSKFHPQSVLTRNLKRNTASLFFYILRLLILQLNIKDTQGTLFMHSNHVHLFKELISQNYFLTTEIIYKLKKKTRILEMPVTLNAEMRPSKVRLIRDGFSFIWQMLELRLR